MARELAFALINPYSIAKSRTGGIIARFLSRTGLELVAARMFGPGEELTAAYAERIRNDKTKDEKMRNVLADYVQRAYMPDPETGRRQRVLMLLFEGEDAIQRVRDVAGPIRPNSDSGETVRDTYGDFITKNDDDVLYIEPAVLIGPDREAASKTLRLWAKYSATDGGIIETAQELPGGPVEQTLVLIKPDNFRFPSSRPGNIMDLFSRSGLRIIGAKIHRMSCGEAQEFYRPLREVLRTQLADVVGRRAGGAVSRELGIEIPDPMTADLGRLFGPLYGDQQFNQIIHLMTGCRPDQCPKERINEPGEQRCLALVYAGLDAVHKIKSVLGPTAPDKAEPGTAGRDLGKDIMVHAAHASESAADAAREIAILNIEEETVADWIHKYYGEPA